MVENNFILFFLRVLWRQRGDIPGHFIHNSVGDSLCRLVKSHKQVTQLFILHINVLICSFHSPPQSRLSCTEKPWRCFLERLTFFSAQLMSVCWQLSSHCPVKIPFKWMKLSGENKQRGEIRGSSGVNTKPNYYSSNWREETPGCSPEWPILTGRLPTPRLLLHSEVSLLELLNLQEF